jgi:hypothetical protein
MSGIVLTKEQNISSAELNAFSFLFNCINLNMNLLDILHNSLLINEYASMIFNASLL